jgi:hypothetical protein
MKKFRWIVLLSLAACLINFSTVFAQGDVLKLSLSRDWGYGGFNNDIQGTFSMKVSGPSNLSRVEFYIDDTKMGEVNKSPFNLQFNTDKYPAGVHVLRAVGITSDGSRLNSNQLKTVFVSAAEGSSKTFSIMIPILVVSFGAIILSAIVPLLTWKKAKNLPAGTRRTYPFGGGICPKCGRPFGFQLFSINLITGKLALCPYCGKWSMVGRASLEKLRAAEVAELEAEKDHIPQSDAEEKQKKELDDSRYQEM